MSHRNEDMIRNNYEAFPRGDANPLLDSLSEDIQWHVSGQSPSRATISARLKYLNSLQR
jgi:ketosteroid isomerase-like protein